VRLAHIDAPARLSKIDAGANMLCDRCKHKEATFEFTWADQPPGARIWHLCDSCLQHLAPGTPNSNELQQKAIDAGGTYCGWTSYSPKNKGGDTSA